MKDEMRHPETAVNEGDDAPQIAIFTDLDGTLLDHHSYRFDQALPALERVRNDDIPLILTTSKTLAEAAVINQALQNRHPVIVENGAVIGIPDGYFNDTVIGSLPLVEGYRVLYLSNRYDEVIAVITELRKQRPLPLRGFHDMDCEGVMAETGLQRAEAERARKRLAVEPFLWLDGEQPSNTFLAALRSRGLKVTRGGRFWHLMGPCSKDTTIDELIWIYRRIGVEIDTVIALGDGPNDIEMLNAADIAIAIQGANQRHISCHGKRETHFSEAAGPTGWNRMVLQCLDSLQGRTHNQE